MNQKTEKTNPKVAFFYSLGQIGSDLSWYMINTYLTVFYTDVVGLSAVAISMIMLIARIWDAVNDPMMGAIADRTKTRWGTFRPYLMFAPPFLALFNILTFTVFPVEGALKVAICMICYIGAGMAYTVVNISYGGLINRIAKNSQVRMNYVTAKSIAASVLSMILSAVVMPVILFFSNTMKNGEKAADNPVFLLSVSALIGLTMCSGNICTGMLADCIDYGDYEYGVRDEGLTFSFMGFGVKLATAITGSVTVLLLAKVGYVPNADQTETAKMGINALVNLFPAAVMLLSVVPLFFYRLDGKMDEIANALDERNGGK